ncbi:OmpA family protein [Zeaxanthinibacter sp. PT1]|uniref:OmpA family protein n=1 Tax=Zeaxanthinibacter TaxID=561554 RepID=UPI0023490B64|nr:OmpA family protein [Zeaxanthinibacter sp. PT1]MDC6350627.1 OmpA family protein [Zeaxanthinibacter sp. PT1]
MKINITFILALTALLLVHSGFAQTPVNSSVEANNGIASVSYASHDARTGRTNGDERDNEDFIDEAKRYKILTRKFDHLPEYKNGYYIVAGVFGERSNARKSVRNLNNKGFEADFIFNPSNKMHYVFLQHNARWQDAIEACNSKLDNSYGSTTWILQMANPVQDRESLVKAAVETEQMVLRRELQEVQVPNTALKKKIAQVKERDLNTPTTVKESFLKASSPSAYDDSPTSKLLMKADQYFNKMWYAEAAELYELALEDSENHSFKTIERVGDAHYYNTNMERAYYWYDMLYDKYKKEMSTDNIFKYAHSLKGTGKYSRAKRLMRLYNKELEKQDQNRNGNIRRETRGEVVLDNILNSESLMEVKNLDINSKYSDFSPMRYGEDQLLFASAADSSFFSTRRYKWNNQPYLDLYVAKMNEESQEVRDAVKFDKTVNTKYHEASVTFSPDQKTIYFTRNNYGKKLKRDKHGVNHLKIYRSVKTEKGWTEAEPLSFTSDDYSTGHPALSPDGKQMYFVSDMPGTIGATDIFVVDVREDGSFSDPRNLGPEINTDRKEMFPFINNDKLYFSSDGHVGLGGLDIFEVAFNQEDGFLEVRNMGRPVNSNKDDFSFIIDEETQKGFFASNRSGGKGDDDIYSFKKLIPEEVNENAIAGIVTEIVNGEVVPEALVTLLDENNRTLKEVVTEADGSFVFEELDGNTKYSIKVSKESYFESNSVVSTLDNQRIDTSVELKKLEELIAVEDGIRKIKMDMIYFDFDKFNIRQDASEELDKLVAILNEYPSMVIKIESHTDSRGPKVYNTYLSDKRAKSTRDYLVSQGIDPKRIQSAIGYGEDRLLNNCDGSVRCSSQQHQLNRRSEFIIVDM